MLVGSWYGIVEQSHEIGHQNGLLNMVENEPTYSEKGIEEEIEGVVVQGRITDVPTLMMLRRRVRVRLVSPYGPLDDTVPVLRILEFFPPAPASRPTPIDLDDPDLDAQCRTVLVKLYRLGKYVAEHQARLHAAYVHAQRDITEIEAEGLSEAALEVTLEEIEQRVAAGTLTQMGATDRRGAARRRHEQTLRKIRRRLDHVLEAIPYPVPLSTRDQLLERIARDPEEMTNR